MTNYGYTRVSTDKQDLQTQEAMILERCPDAIIHGEKTSGASQKPVLMSLIDVLKKGDTLYLYSFDRLSRRTSEAHNMMEDLVDRGVHIVSLTQNIDTTTDEGELQFTVLVGLSHYERKLISRRTKHKLAQMKARGEKLGRPCKERFTDAMAQFVLKEQKRKGQTWQSVTDRLNKIHGTSFKVQNVKVYAGRFKKRTA